MKALSGRFGIFSLLSASLVVAAGLACGSCNTSGCTDNHSAIPQAGFYAMATHKPLTLDSVAVGGIGAPDDSLLVYPGKRVSTLNLPFRWNRQEVGFFFHYAYPAQGLDNPRLNDTLTFSYTARPFFASEECGAMFIYQVHAFTYTRHLIDSVAVTDTMITNVDRERIQIFFRTDTSSTATTPTGRATRHKSLRP